MKNKRQIPLLFILFAIVLTLSSCFAGAQDDRSTSGERDGVAFCFLEDEGLLILSGADRIGADSRIFSLPFAQNVRYVYFSSGTHDIDPAAPDSLKNLKRMYCADPASSFEKEFTERADADFSVDDFEKRTDLPFAHAVGHCLSEVKNACLICGQSFSLSFDDYRCRLYKDRESIRSSSVVVEGKDLVFDSDGYLLADGFLSLGGEKRYYENGVFVIGKKEIDGVRYTFSSEGVLTSEKAVDQSVPAYQIVWPIAAIAIGGGLCYGVYRFAAYRIKKEEEDDTP